MQTFKDATAEEISKVMEQAWAAFEVYSTFSLRQRAGFMRAIAGELELISAAVVATAMKETNLPEARLKNELTRTIFQLNSYADACEQGNWLEARIDTAIPDRNPPKTDLRKMLVPLGPVVVFGASNFPFAYSTAGGDTACALAAGCPVIVKAHPAHAQTSEMVAECIIKAARQSKMPDGIFAHVHGAGFEVGKSLVMHARTKAVGFTGSYTGGKALFDWAAQRKEPIPVFAEMGSINPVYLLPEKLSQSPVEQAKVYAGSITLSAGQFCTNPGLIIGIDNADLKKFITTLGNEIEQVAPSAMLHPGIAKAFAANRSKALAQEQVHTVAIAQQPPQENQGIPTIASATAQAFLNNPILHQEVFGPYSLVIRCKDMEEMIAVAKHMEGQLTTTLIATETDMRNNAVLVETVKNSCGRIIINGVPTGVEVCMSMQHGGPFPATTDARFTAVGADGIKRFARPLCFQNWPNSLLPDELKDSNPLGIWRTVNNELTKA
ncbi:aldehyde dehydrogenase (NADP(+)) [Agriterribacter sp.]|uniref:aldehyde dehydrogenase (NADP(+)) n=1 Tax=Agriterribacter sp. TaxID=2821509 RepID=UPI002CFB1A00|nr:aldehyde dehydrogenase (NADP(+)) [Agriterribacter sp.]HRO48411.1 aldehyde dehydrogenase (NADP(+)) [Agriterribacter sp.]HRQ17272.1 aldehyde dehydrogenase (NADP(+)) [Agriterribacter sp.]